MNNRADQLFDAWLNDRHNRLGYGCHESEAIIARDAFRYLVPQIPVPTPTTWTREDHAARRLPPVGAVGVFMDAAHLDQSPQLADWRSGDELEVLDYVTLCAVTVLVVKNRREGVGCPISSVALACIVPRESPEEKAARLEQEFVLDAAVACQPRKITVEFIDGLREAYRLLVAGKVALPEVGK